MVSSNTEQVDKYYKNKLRIEWSFANYIYIFYVIIYIWKRLLRNLFASVL